jgi:hypothetical protein
LTGSAKSLPIALFESSTNNSEWITIPDCSTADGCTTNIDLGSTFGSTSNSIVIRLTNQGGSQLIVEKSKPPVGTTLFSQDPIADLAEGLIVSPGSSSSATILFQPAAPSLNSEDVTYSATWTINTNDPLFGLHILKFTATAISEKTGPMTPRGDPRYQYLGCFQDSTAKRLQPKESVSATMSNGLCQNTSLASTAVFAGTEYMNECWYGLAIPSSSLHVADSLCNYQCAGDNTQRCGGFGTFISMYYDSMRYFPDNGTILGFPVNPPIVGPYSFLGCCKSCP